MQLIASSIIVGTVIAIFFAIYNCLKWELFSLKNRYYSAALKPYNASELVICHVIFYGLF